MHGVSISTSRAFTGLGDVFEAVDLKTGEPVGEFEKHIVEKWSFLEAAQPIQGLFAVKHRIHRLGDSFSDIQVEGTCFHPTFELVMAEEAGEKSHFICPISHFQDDQGRFTLNAWCFNLSQTQLYRIEDLVMATDLETGDLVHDLERHIREGWEFMHCCRPMKDNCPPLSDLIADQ